MELGPVSGAARPEQHRFPCPTCGADLRYAPELDRLKCAHCGHEEAIPEHRGAIPELDLRAVERNALPAAETEEIRVAQCPSCGAQIEFDADIHARECPFCASPIVTDTGVQRQIKPQAQLPFLLSEDQARAAMNKWLGRLWFAPSDLRAYARAGRAMQGMYVPYWTYDAETRSRYTGQRGTVYHVERPVQVVVNGRRQTTMQRVAQVRWQPVRGEVARDFDDVLVLGSRSLPKRFTDALAPWDLSALSAYEPRFLAGFRAEGYTVPVEAAYGEARDEMDAVIAQDVRRDIGGDQQRVGQVETDVGRLTFKHVLLPVWLAAYRYRGKSFRFVVNGRTGTVQGERPYSSVKIAIAIALALLVAGVIAWLQIAQS
jgi:DNA-directed RNA polymerase subunit RPC12/RpoP